MYTLTPNAFLLLTMKFALSTRAGMLRYNLEKAQQLLTNTGPSLLFFPQSPIPSDTTGSWRSPTSMIFWRRSRMEQSSRITSTTRAATMFRFTFIFSDLHHCSILFRKGYLCCIRIQYNGKYDFRLTDPATNVDSIAHARFTYVFSTTDGKEWKIQTHHSSLLPETDETHRLRG